MGVWKEWVGNMWESNTVGAASTPLAVTDRLRVLQSASGPAVEATVDDLAQACRAAIVVAGATLTLSAAYRNRPVVLGKADGQTITLPATTGSGHRYRLVIGTAITSVGTVITALAAGATYKGLAQIMGASALVSAAAAAGNNTITLNGSTKGGLVGTTVELEDVATNVWAVSVLGVGSGSAETPFSTAS